MKSWVSGSGKEPCELICSPRDREIKVICRSGQRAFTATRILLQHGFTATDVSGGMLSRAQTVTLGAEAANSR